MKQEIGIGLAGFGTVGAGVYKHLGSAGALIAQRTGLGFSVKKIAVRDPGKPRSVQAPPELFTVRLDDLLEDPAIQVVVELIGGVDEALQFVKKAIESGKPVVTGNKALLAEHGAELFHLAKEKGVPIYYEAAVAGGIPIIKSVRQGFVGNRFESIHGILNGTSNYILSRMTDAGLGYPQALEEARALGYAEADPTLDVNGWDAAHKAIILAALAYGFWISPKEILVSGIEQVTAEDVRFAHELGYKIKLLATIKSNTAGRVEVRVCPTLVPESHVLASVGGVFNAVSVRGDVVGDTLFYGRGAGQDPTSSSVLGDLVEAAANLTSSPYCTGFTSYALYEGPLPPSQILSKFYLRLAVEDRPGVLAQIAGVLGDSGIGILSVIQPETHQEGPVPLILMIHDASAAAMQEATCALGRLEAVKSEPTVFHVESFS